MSEDGEDAVVEERPSPQRERLRPLGAPTDPLRPTGRIQGGGPREQATSPRMSLLRVALLGIALTVAAVVLFAVLAVFAGIYGFGR